MASVEIEIFKRSDENLLFSPIIFCESIQHFEESCGNSLDLFQYSTEEIKKRKRHLNTIVKDVPNTINAKIDMIINIIKTTDNYIGLMTYH